MAGCLKTERFAKLQTRHEDDHDPQMVGKTIMRRVLEAAILDPDLGGMSPDTTRNGNIFDNTSDHCFPTANICEIRSKWMLSLAGWLWRPKQWVKIRPIRYHERSLEPLKGSMLQ